MRKGLLAVVLSALWALAPDLSAQAAQRDKRAGPRERSVIDCHKARRNGTTCLACNIYFEARGEPISGQAKVAQVTLARRDSKHYPKTLCAVVWQPRQFSWTDDGRSDKVYDRDAWARALTLAGTMISEHRRGPATKAGTSKSMTGVLWYHSKKVKPKWARTMRRHATEGGHIFYRAR
jgi:N-acetylmuramoyl-L-alanine amidase